MAGEKFDRISEYTYGNPPDGMSQPGELTPDDEAVLLGNIADYGCNSSFNQSGDYVNHDSEVPF